MRIEDFLLARIADDEARVLADCAAKRRIIELHKTWPVLITSPPAVDLDVRADLGSYVARMTQEIAWQTTKEYIDRFGVDPPTGPILAVLALPYANHPDYNLV